MEVHEIAIDQRMLDARVCIPQTVVYRSFTKETVVLNLETGLYHGVNRSGGRMLEVLERTGLLRQAAEQLAGEFGRDFAEIARDLSEFCTQLAERGLVKLEFAKAA